MSNEEDDSFRQRVYEFDKLLKKAAPKRKIINWIFRNIFNIDTGRACLPWNYKGVYFDIVKGHNINHERTNTCNDDNL